MKEFLVYIDIVILVVVVIFLFFTLRRFLGKKVGYQVEDVNLESNNLSTGTKLNTSQLDIKDESLSKPRYPAGSLFYKLDQIRKIDSSFNNFTFIASAKKAYDMIVKAFALGDLTNVRAFISEKVQQIFLDNIAKRGSNKIYISSIEFISADIVDARIESNNDCFISVRFVAKYYKDESFNSNIKDHKEVWVFFKNLKENSSIWKLVKVSSI